MDTLQTIFERRSIRTYKHEPIPAAHLQQILEAARQAPSASNRQPWHFVVVGEPKLKEQVAEACGGQMWMADAAYIIVAVGIPALSSKWYRVDVAIALQNLVLAAWSLGYGTCWIGDFNPARLKELCHIPADMDIVACTPLGVPHVKPAGRERKAWATIFSADRYGQPLLLGE
jgi:nitroreductase